MTLIPMTTPPANESDALDRVVEWFVAGQRPKAVETKPHDQCVYRTADGKNACGIGCLLPDVVYEEGRLEFLASLHVKSADQAGYQLPAVCSVVRHSPLWDAWFKTVKVAFLNHLQCAHDHAHTSAGFLAALQRLDPTRVLPTTSWKWK